MELDKYKIGECLRVYAAVLAMSIDNDISFYEAFSRYLMNNETSLTIDDYNMMMLVKIYYSASMILFYSKDITAKGLEGTKVDATAHFLDTSSNINKTCIENFTERDIVNYIRNALAHSKNDLYKITINGKKSTLAIKLKNTIASKGPNMGLNVPFEVELNVNSLLGVSLFCSYYAKILSISGVKYDENLVKNYSAGNVLDLLKKTINTTYYEYDLFKQMKYTDKNRVLESQIEGNIKKDFTNYDAEKAKYIRKTDKVELSIIQKNAIYSAIKEKAQKLVSSDKLKYLKQDNSDIQSIKTIVGILMREYFEYEALKTIPLGKEKKNNHLISILINGSTDKYEKFSAKQERLLNSFIAKGDIYQMMNMFVNLDREESTMFVQNLCDDNYLKQEALACYYNFVFENFVPENVEVSIGNKMYKADRIRNSFTHGRWFPDNNGYWILYDNKDSIKKPDQYRFDWREAISFKSLDKFVNKKYFEVIEKINDTEKHISK